MYCIVLKNVVPLYRVRQMVLTDARQLSTIDSRLSTNYKYIVLWNPRN